MINHYIWKNNLKKSSVREINKKKTLPKLHKYDKIKKTNNEELKLKIRYNISYSMKIHIIKKWYGKNITFYAY